MASIYSCKKCGANLNLNTVDLFPPDYYFDAGNKNTLSFARVDPSKLRFEKEDKIRPFFETLNYWGIQRNRTMIKCNNCGCVVGHVYDDGPPLMDGHGQLGFGPSQVIPRVSRTTLPNPNDLEKDAKVMPKPRERNSTHITRTHNPNHQQKHARSTIGNRFARLQATLCRIIISLNLKEDRRRTIFNHHLARGRRPKIKITAFCSTLTGSTKIEHHWNRIMKAKERLATGSRRVSRSIADLLHQGKIYTLSSMELQPPYIFTLIPYSVQTLIYYPSLNPPFTSTRSQSTKSVHVYMDKHNRSYKNALCSKGKTPIDIDPFTDQTPTPRAEKAGVEAEKLANPPAEEAYGGLEENIKEKFLDFDIFMQKLARVEDNIKHLKETTIFITFWKGTAEASRLKAKLKAEWICLHGEFELTDRSNNWYEVRFSNPIDRENIWDNRPYYAFGNLLILTPWIPNFDPQLMKVKVLDVWVRILFLPTEYITPDLVAAIIEHNNIGKFIRMDPFMENRIRVKYARVCVTVKNQHKFKDHVLIPTPSGDLKSFRIWYEGMSIGCGSCGAEDHEFQNCPLRINNSKFKNYKPDKFFNNTSATNNFTEESSVDRNKAKAEWKDIPYKRGKTAYTIQLNTEKKIEHYNPDPRQQQQHEDGGEVRILNTINVIDQHPGLVNQEPLTFAQMNYTQEQQLPLYNIDQTFLQQGNVTLNMLKKNEEEDDDSFKTGAPGNSRTSLTQRMREVNVEEDSDKAKRRKKGDTDDTASSNSKRTRLNKNG